MRPRAHFSFLLNVFGQGGAFVMNV
jgi:hypothetical protein